MNKMVSLVLTYRDRSPEIVKKCLDSLKIQSNADFEVLFVNYGSSNDYTKEIIELVRHYENVSYLHYDVPFQLWNKSRAINIALQKCKYPLFFVGDVDMIYRSDFIEKLVQYSMLADVVYFQVGFLNKEESKLNKSFEDYQIKHLSNENATGMSLFSTDELKSIQGYDEFYHGWGAEDTDVHIRLKNKGKKVRYFDQEILLLHQWHERNYRTTNSEHPFHSGLEKINMHYLKMTNTMNKELANTGGIWGRCEDKIEFKKEDHNQLILSNCKPEIDAFLLADFELVNGTCIHLIVKPHTDFRTIKNWLKMVLKKKYHEFYDFQTLNDLLLERVIEKYRYHYYEYYWDRSRQLIHLKIASL